VLLTFQQAAELAGYNKSRISQLVKEGRIATVDIEKPAQRGPRRLIDSEVLREFLRNPPLRQRSSRTGVQKGTLGSPGSGLPPLEPGGDMPAPSGPCININPKPTLEPAVLGPPPPKPPPQKPAARSAPRASAGDDDFSQFLNDDGSYNMERCRAWGEFEKARKLQVERMAAEGKYVAVADVAPVWSRVFVSINRGIMGIANRVKADHPDLDVSVVNQIEYLCREALKAVSEEVKSLDIS